MKLTIRRGARAVTCKTCGGRMFWADTASGKRAPANADGAPHTCAPRAPAAARVVAGLSAAEIAAVDAAEAKRQEREAAHVNAFLSRDTWNGRGPPCPFCGTRHHGARCDPSATLQDPSDPPTTKEAT